MICRETTEKLGSYVDGELPPAMRSDLETHLATCRSCAAELESLRKLVSELAEAPAAAPPDALWTAIERRLDRETQVSESDDHAAGETDRPVRPVGEPSTRLKRARVVRLALAAAVLFAVGIGSIGSIGLIWTGSTARASTVDFSVLLDALPLDAQKAFRKFLVLYDAKEGSPASAKHYAPDLNFDLPELLPGGFRLEAVYLLRFGKLPGVAATYNRDGEFLGAVFHRPVHKENFGPHRDYPCLVGRHKGHKVSVGDWKLVHLMDPTTCHCVLSRLEEESELPAVMTVLAPTLHASQMNGHDH